MKGGWTLVALGALAAILALAGVATAKQVFYAGGQLEVPLPESDAVWEEADQAPYDCEEYERCPDELEGTSYDDHHVGPAIDSAADEEAYYRLMPESPLQLLQGWQVCGFDATGATLFCHTYDSGDWTHHIPIPVETEHLRVTLRPHLPSAYTIDVRAV